MASLPVRDPVGDHLLTPQNAALVVIDWPSQFEIRSMDRDLLLENIVSTVKAADAFDCRSSIRRSTSQLGAGNRPCPLRGVARGQRADRPDDDQRVGGRRVHRRRARHRTTQGDPVRTLDRNLYGLPRPRRLERGYDVYPVVDAIGNASEEAHRAGIERVLQAGAQPVTWVALAVELQRDWAREETVADVVEIVLAERLLRA